MIKKTYQGEFKASHVCWLDWAALLARVAVDGGVNLELGQSSKFFFDLSVELHFDAVTELHNPLKKD